MNTSMQQDVQESPLSAAVFMGDFNTGKSLIINALLRQDILFISREESRTPPVFIARGDVSEALYGARPKEGQDPESKSHEQFLSIRHLKNEPCDSDALGVLLPNMPFRHFTFVDTPGASTDDNKPAILNAAQALDNTIFVLTTTLEYWPARHTMALIKEYHAHYPGRFIVVANMADQMNANDIRRVRDRAGARLERNGITPAPPFFPVSARLELARRRPGDEYRRRIKPEVRELCDAGFDAFRVALYEFEATVSAGSAGYDLDSLLTSTLTTAVTINEKGQDSC